ncbi:MAG: 2-amino-4-hydroxy-6-hydroxymethyldihydropteridine diphosphokinase [Syntrophomonadaceae bacterium]|nr:2-amino-4-hydroxy-6-hydroxymethyldihydropteridine diphosphokinase [Syntrophomonadaceae bacterium]
MSTKAYIGLGSNIGDKKINLGQARVLIEDLEGVRISEMSSLYETSPWGKTDQEGFLNQVIEIETELNPLELLRQLQAIEIKLGRRRQVHWGPRNIDLDVLLYGREIIDQEELKVPHPYLMQRLFVLVPLAEIDSELEFPDGSKIGEVLTRLTKSADTGDLRKL